MKEKNNDKSLKYFKQHGQRSPAVIAKQKHDKFITEL